MSYSSQSHPSEDSLKAFMEQVDSNQSADISLHLAECLSCREQVSTMSRLKMSAEHLKHENVDEDQQQILEDFLYAKLPEQQQELLKQKIKNNPLLLKEALMTLSQQQFETEQFNSEPTKFHGKETNSFLDKVKQWLHSESKNWLSIPVTAVATLLLAVVVFQGTGLNNSQQQISVASFQDHNVIRFIPRNKLPGIGFFSSSNQYSEPYENIIITLNDNSQLALEWQPVNKASEYNLTISRYSEGSKQLREEVKTWQTHATIKLTEADYNQRFEWTLSGKTTDDESFVTTGGFVMNRTAK